MSRKLQYSFPSFLLKREQYPDEQTFRGIEAFGRGVQKMYKQIVSVVNHNRIEFVSQDAKPTPEKGRIYLWEDTDATAGNPTHYIVANFEGTVITFASEETA